MTSVVRETVIVELENGLHLVPCSHIARIASNYDCQIRVSREDQTANAKTVLELITLNATKGAKLMLEAEGEGETEAISRLVELFQSNFEDVPGAG